jgi:hypothetical protein
VKLKVVIPSKRRAHTVAAESLVLFPDAYLLVDEAEKDDYKGVVKPSRLLTHPGLTTLSAIRNHMIDNVKADVVVTADDDVINLKAMVGWYARSRLDPEVCRQVLETTAQCAMDARCSVFGFNQNSNPQHFKPFDPIKLCGWVGSVFGLVGDHGLRFDERLVCHQDVDLALQALQRDRIVWIEDRWCFVNKRFTNRGGLTGARTADSYEEAQALMRSKWGSYVNFKTNSSDPRRRKRGLHKTQAIQTSIRGPRKSSRSPF